MNHRKNMITKTLWFLNQEEYKQLKNSLDSNNKETALDILFEIHRRGDL